MFISTVPWMDGIYISGSEGWFITGRENALMYMEMETNVLKFVSQLPPKECILRGFSNCMKYEDKLVCIPYMATFFFVYLMRERRYVKTSVENPDNIYLQIVCHMEKDGVMYAVSWTLKQMIVIDLTSLCVIKQYAICSEEDSIWASVFAGSKLYSTSLKDNSIFITDIREYITLRKKLPDNIGKILRIVYHNGYLYLSGTQKEIYIWDCQQKLEIVKGFPEEFGEYIFNSNENTAILDCTAKEYENSCFLYEIAVGDKIWFIPFKTNKVLYIEEKKQKLETLELSAENEDRESLKNRLFKSKYLFEYIRENRYIGLYSLKNLCLFEIDSETLEVQYLQIQMHEDDYKKYENSKYKLEIYENCSNTDIIVEGNKNIYLRDFLEYIDMD